MRDSHFECCRVAILTDCAVQSISLTYTVGGVMSQSPSCHGSLWQ
jgi:hypothetical protein